jgi:hypothetical protein
MQRCIKIRKATLCLHEWKKIGFARYFVVLDKLVLAMPGAVRSA